ncbi:hypothetical protein LTR17_006507 [Elasticomyces elasticus]|nr:hypothetical protein LTR17_006507 [Elasticomyces elasticus]
MYLSNGIRVAIAVFCFSQEILGNPVHFSPRSSTLQMSRATIADIGAVHIDTYFDYVNSSALSTRDDFRLEKRGIVTAVQNIKCGIWGGSLDNYDEGRARFGKVAENLGLTGGAFTLYAVKIVLQDAICNTENCDLIVDLVADVHGQLFADHLQRWADVAFEQFREECQGYGGSAELIASDPKASDVCGIPTCTADGQMGLRVATFDVEFQSHDSGETCPANPPKEEVCDITSFN